jgi:hypothetical protein
MVPKWQGKPAIPVGLQRLQRELQRVAECKIRRMLAPE